MGELFSIDHYVHSWFDSKISTVPIPCKNKNLRRIFLLLIDIWTLLEICKWSIECTFRLFTMVTTATASTTRVLDISTRINVSFTYIQPFSIQSCRSCYATQHLCQRSFYKIFVKFRNSKKMYLKLF